MAQRIARDRGEQGFTVIEVLIALLVLLIGMAGILSMQLTSVQATGFSRHATEATMLAEDKMEELRTMSGPTLVGDTDTVNARGEPDTGPFTRVWTITPGPPIAIEVNVTWVEQGQSVARDVTVADPYTITLRTQRGQ